MRVVDIRVDIDVQREVIRYDNSYAGLSLHMLGTYVHVSGILF